MAHLTWANQTTASSKPNTHFTFNPLPRIKFALPYKVITFNKDFEVSMVAYSTREIFWFCLLRKWLFNQWREDIDLHIELSMIGVRVINVTS